MLACLSKRWKGGLKHTWGGGGQLPYLYPNYCNSQNRVSKGPQSLVASKDLQVERFTHSSEQQPRIWRPTLWYLGQVLSQHGSQINRFTSGDKRASERARKPAGLAGSEAFKGCFDDARLRHSLLPDAGMDPRTWRNLLMRSDRNVLSILALQKRTGARREMSYAWKNPINPRQLGSRRGKKRKWKSYCSAAFGSSFS